MLKEIKTLLYKELLIEWKQKYAFNGLLLYVLSMVVVIALAFRGGLNPLTWNIVLWMILLFVAINAIAKSFMAEKSGHLLYLYAMARPAAVILAKIIYNLVLLSGISLITLVAFTFLGGIFIADIPLLIGIIFLGCTTISANLTLVSAIASRAENKTTLLAVLSFPLIVPALLTLIRISRYAIEGKEAGLDVANGYDQFLMLGGMSAALVGISIVLFPFVWRE